ncbi:MAG TPA: PAS domain-containing protein, partial [Longimicrobiaceae bacterium]|nr:PAS domain-containing protein [Longimicrobiaceae bacterium]
MKTLASISRYIDATSSRLDDLATRARTVGDGGRPIVQESLLHLASTLEELRVSEEELRAQADGLASSREGVEGELRRYRELFEGAPDAYLVVDTHGVIREGNRAAGALLGLRAESLEGKPLAVFVPEDDRRAFRQQLPWVRETERMDGWELRLAPRGGEPVRVEVTATPSRGGSGVVDELRLTLRPVRRAKAEAAPAPAEA